MPNEIMDILMPCPFCGKKDELVMTDCQTYDELVHENGTACVSIECKRCYVNVYEHSGVKDYGIRTGLLIAKWNNRNKEAKNENT